MASDVRSNRQTYKWYLNSIVVFIAIIGIGPFAIPLIWISPAFKRWQKLTLIVITSLFYTVDD